MTIRSDTWNRWATGSRVPPVAPVYWGRFVLVAALCALGALGLACERRPVGRRSGDPGREMARVNGTPLYQRDFDSYLPSDYRRAFTASEQMHYLDRWVTTQLLYDAAREQGIGVTSDIEFRIDQLKKDLVADQLVQKVISEEAVVTEGEVRAYYDAHLDEYTREYRVSHIVVGSLEDAAAVQERLKTRTFSWVERRHSLDKHTGVGGDLGFLSKGNMIPEFEDVVFDMEPGSVSDVIESDFGYHVIKLTDVRTSRNKLDYEDAAEEISRFLLLQKRSAVYDALVESLREKAVVEIFDAELRMAQQAEAEADTLD
jgi:peptidyl-prolyl cis-trans isomerase C